MSQLFETIKCKDGKLFNLNRHNLRFNKARKEYFGLSDEINLEEIIEVPENASNGLFRCRVIYSKTVDKIEFIPHQFRKIKSLKLIEANDIGYQFKYSDRNILNELFEKRSDSDDILIVKNGCITDSFTANLLFFDGKKWWTPDTPLLYGTQRAKLIDEEKISVCRIISDDLSKYKKVGLINAMWDLGEMPLISIENIQ
ncbi:MAG: aminotransferase class IV family protein [Draconibacterium sp.]|nr:aminotransferase class IV family protein [Draconibacterium sp.]